jgi:hypothetical protein
MSKIPYLDMTDCGIVTVSQMHRDIEDMHEQTGLNPDYILLDPESAPNFSTQGERWKTFDGFELRWSDEATKQQTA